MAFDLPPDQAPAVEASRFEHAGGFAFPEGFSVIVKGPRYSYQLAGSALIPLKEAEALLRQAQDPADAIALLSEAHRVAGYMLVTVSVEELRPDLVRIRVTPRPVTEIKAADHLQPYFAHLIGVSDLHEGSLFRANAVARTYLARQGQQCQSNFENTPAGMRLVVTEHPVPGWKPWNTVAALNNYGNRYAGQWLAQVQTAYQGGGSEWRAGYLAGLPGLSDDTRGSELQRVNGGYSLATRYGVYGVAASYMDYRTGEGSALHGQTPGTTTWFGQVIPGDELLGFEEGRTTSVQLTGEQIAYAREDTVIAFSENLGHVESEANIAWEFLEGGASYTETPLRQENYTYLDVGVTVQANRPTFGRSAVYTGFLQWTQGLAADDGNFRSSGDETDTNFGLLRARLGYQTQLGGKVPFDAQFSGQFTGSTVPQDQQFVLGGFSKLSAWLPGVASGDNGALARLVFSTPSFSTDLAGLSFNLFYEVGQAEGGDQDKTVTMSDAGVGVAFKAGKFDLGLSYASPIDSGDVADETLDNYEAPFFFNASVRW